MVKCLPEFEYFYCVLENKNIIFKIRRSKVKDYAALMLKDVFITLENHCARTAQSSRGSCSRRVHKMEYLTVNKGNILANVLKY